MQLLTRAHAPSNEAGLVLHTHEVGLRHSGPGALPPTAGRPRCVWGVALTNRGPWPQPPARETNPAAARAGFPLQGRARRPCLKLGQVGFRPRAVLGAGVQGARADARLQGAHAGKQAGPCRDLVAPLFSKFELTSKQHHVWSIIDTWLTKERRKDPLSP